MHRYLVILEAPTRNGERHYAYAPDLLGCIATGNTEMEAIAEIMEAIELHVKERAEEGVAIPSGNSRAVEVAVRVPDVRPSERLDTDELTGRR